MSDAETPVQPANPAGDAEESRPLTPEAIDRVLGDFRQWLGQLTTVPAPVEVPPSVDLHTLIAQFTALRHEINLGTKATRATLEQNGEALTLLRGVVQQLQDVPETEDAPDPALKALIDIYDNLALALRQVTRQRDAIEQPLMELLAPPIRRGWFQAKATPTGTTLAAVNLVRASFDSLLSGYTMSLARVDRVLEQSELEVIATEGESFDPELMEAVEVVGDTGLDSGEVIEEVRRGYLRGEVVFRYAQVKVAR